MKSVNYLLVLVVAIAVVIASWLLSNALINRNKNDNTITVTGLGEKEFESDLIVWNGSFSRKNMVLGEAYASLNQDKEKVRQYLLSKGVRTDEIVFSAVALLKDIQTNYVDGRVAGTLFNGYILTQNVTIQSKDVNKVESISREVTELINSGVEFNSDPPQYYYTKLADLKQEMVGAASSDGRLRALRIADSAKANLGGLKKAAMGVFQITAPNSNEDYSWGGSFNTSSKKKKASITVKMEYGIR